MRLHIFSDIHLEFGDCPVEQTDADVVIAAGDIDQQTGGIEWLQRFEKPVIYVAGNHELWGGELDGTLDRIRQSCIGTNIHFLENNQVEIGGVTFFGCTLWSDFHECDPHVLEHSRQYMNDFAYIAQNGRASEPEDLVIRNQTSLLWLEKALNSGSDGKRVVVTHHAPSLRSWGFDPEELLRYAYCNQLDDMIRSHDIALWAHGHVHCSSNYHIGDTQVVCNPRGYFKRKLVAGFLPARVVEI